PPQKPQQTALGGPPPDVEDDGIGDTRIERRRAPADDKTRFFGAGDDFDLKSDFLANPRKKHVAIGRLATRFGGDIAPRGDPAAGDLARADLERVESTSHCVFREGSR